jgi:hypothetical protein
MVKFGIEPGASSPQPAGRQLSVQNVRRKPREFVARIFDHFYSE